MSGLVMSSQHYPIADASVPPNGEKNIDLTLAVNVFGTKIKKLIMFKVIQISVVLQLSSLHLEIQGLLTQLYDGKMEKG